MCGRTYRRFAGRAIAHHQNLGSRVEREKHRQPDDIDEMPVSRPDQERHVAPVVEIARKTPEKDQQDRDQAHSDVRHVEACDRVVERAVASAAHRVRLCLPFEELDDRGMRGQAGTSARARRRAAPRAPAQCFSPPRRCVPLLISRITVFGNASLSVGACSGNHDGPNCTSR